MQPKNPVKRHIIYQPVLATMVRFIYDYSVNRAISTAFNTETSLNTIPKHLKMDENNLDEFAESTNARAEISKFTESIGSVNVSLRI